MLATIQVDIDPLWTAFSKTPEFSFSQTENSIYASTVDTFLQLFEEYGVKATFFVVGRDLEKKIALDSVEKILAAGHEVANHTYTHTSFNGGTFDEKVRDIENFAEIFGKNFNQPVSGFKAPCYAIDEKIMRYLDERYLYDSSMISTSMSPLLKLYYKLKGQYVHGDNWGRLPHLFAPRSPYRCNLNKIWQRGESRIILLPITSTPYASLPFHFSFINIFGLKYFEWNYRLLRLSASKIFEFRLPRHRSV